MNSDTPVKEAEIVVPGSSPAKPAQMQPSLEDLVKAAAPLVTTYIEGQKEMEKESYAFEEKVLIHDGRRDRNLIISGTIIAVSVLILAGILITQGKDSSAMELIKLVAMIISAGLGGFGIGQMRKKRKDDAES